LSAYGKYPRYRTPSSTPSSTPSPSSTTSSTPSTLTIAAGRLRASTRVFLVAGVLGIASVGLTSVGPTRPAPAQAAVAAPAQAAVTTAAHVSAAARVNQHLRLNAWKYALRQHRKPYIFGGTGPRGFDCSGLVYASYRSRGVGLPRTTYAMLASRHLIRIRKSQARRGDLAFFGSGHVELYDHGNWTYGAAHTGTEIGYHRMNSYWHPTMYFRVRR
jgi:cell wall-associated NlpC family hydrolase